LILAMIGPLILRKDVVKLYCIKRKNVKRKIKLIIKSQMQTAKRKLTKDNYKELDPLITQKKFDELVARREDIKKKLPHAREEVMRLALMGDFSENVAYQMAKGKLRGLNQRILEIDNQLKHSQIIQPSKNNDIVQLGHTVTLVIGKSTKDFQILGSVESDPATGIISLHSPLGQALLGKKAGDEFALELANRIVRYKIVKIK